MKWKKSTSDPSIAPTPAAPRRGHFTLEARSKRDANNVTRRVLELVIPGARRRGRTSQEDMAPTDEGRHDGRGCYPGYGPRPERVETKGRADP